jgi:hypothetical protein
MALARRSVGARAPQTQHDSARHSETAENSRRPTGSPSRIMAEALEDGHEVPQPHRRACVEAREPVGVEEEGQERAEGARVGHDRVGAGPGVWHLPTSSKASGANAAAHATVYWVSTVIIGYPHTTSRVAGGARYAASGRVGAVGCAARNEACGVACERGAPGARSSRSTSSAARRIWEILPSVRPSSAPISLSFVPR